jgi:hypothetical protein
MLEVDFQLLRSLLFKGILVETVIVHVYQSTAGFRDFAFHPNIFENFPSEMVLEVSFPYPIIVDQNEGRIRLIESDEPGLTAREFYELCAAGNLATRFGNGARVVWSSRHLIREWL